ncbi:MAG: putative DNA methylase [Candidatus Endobugula sp.]|jgi:putative DNA methylase
MSNTKATKIYSPKKLIEVALPLDDINVAAAREKSIRHGHPSTLHLWWARRPLAAARAVIFAQMVNDPGYQQDGGFKYGVNKKDAEIKREKLFQIIRDLVKWENTNNEDVLNRAREAIKESWCETCHLNRKHPQAAELFNPEKLPAFHDPFAGGGAIPLEAQRLGLESYASDLNPVAVMINKAMIEIPPKFAGQAPVGPLPESDKTSKKKSTKDMLEDWSGAKGLAEDVRRYGHWMREEAFKRIGHLYPKVKITDEMIAERPDLKPYTGEELTVIAWLWARTVKSPNPAFSHVDVPLAASFVLSGKKNKEVYVQPVVENDSYNFYVKVGKPPAESKAGTKTARGANFNCLLSGTPITGNYIKEQGKLGFMGTRLLAVVAEGKGGRVFLSPTAEEQVIADSASPQWKPNTRLPDDPRNFWTISYGLETYGDLFTSRQLNALVCLSDLVQEARNKVVSDAKAAGMSNDELGIDTGGEGATAYGDALAVYLAFIVEQVANHSSSICGWNSANTQMRSVFARQAIPMTWDFAECNIFSGSSGSYFNLFERMVKGFTALGQGVPGNVEQADAATQGVSQNKVISSDPPYYDNIGYADLSDFFYVWMRRALKSIYPDLFSTLAVPKTEELVASPYRHGNKESAENFFLGGMTQAIHNMAEKGHPAFPVTIYYAFKQADTKEGSTSSTGWETFLEAVISAGFSIDGTWPVRTEKQGRVIGNGTNALASSVVLVCKKREIEAASISRREFQRELRDQMPDALEAMIGGETGATPIAPVDLAQAAIGPGMAIYSKYAAVLNQDGSKMSVHDALILINRAITDYLNPDSGNFDADTLFCDDWFSQYGWGEGQFGEADTLARAKGTSVDGVRDAGVIEAEGGKVRLLKWSEYPQDWDPKTDTRTPIWEACHQMIRVLNQQGESEAGSLLARMPERGEPIRQLAYHLYTLCERKKWAEEARAYNELIGSWHAIVSSSHELGEKYYGETTDMGF